MDAFNAPRPKLSSSPAPTPPPIKAASKRPAGWNASGAAAQKQQKRAEEATEAKAAMRAAMKTVAHVSAHASNGHHVKSMNEREKEARIAKLEKELQDARLTVPKLKLESLEERLEAATLENAALKQQLRATEAALHMKMSAEGGSSGQVCDHLSDVPESAP